MTQADAEHRAQLQEQATALKSKLAGMEATYRKAMTHSRLTKDEVSQAEKNSF